MGYIDMQIRQLDAMRPGSWVPGVKQAHRHSKTYTCTAEMFNNNDIDVALVTIANLLADKDTRSTRVEYINGDKGTITMYFTTPAKFLDVLTINVCSQEKADAQGFVSLSIVSRSTSAVPASVPGAPLLGAVMTFFPFLDWGQNNKHIYHVANILNEEGIVSDDQVRRHAEEQEEPAVEGADKYNDGML